jgi:predicted  nucleic acid-binding Zn-ribbon protein
VDADVQILTHRVTALEDTMGEAIGEIRDGIKEIAANTGKLAILEERHAETRDGLARAFAEIKSNHDRLDAVEAALPPLKEARGWIITAMLGIVGAFGFAMIGLVLAR